MFRGCTILSLNVIGMEYKRFLKIESLKKDVQGFHSCYGISFVGRCLSQTKVQSSYCARETRHMCDDEDDD